MKTIIIHHRSSHHAQNSGYGRLGDYITAKQIPSGNHSLPYILAKFIGDRSNQSAGIYDSNSVQKEFELFKTLLSSGKEQNIVHYLNAERDVRFIVKNTSFFKNSIFCGTFHKPPEILFKTIINTRYLKQLNGAIAVGLNQVDFLKNWLDIEMVNYIPHGVDTHFFVPDFSKRKSNTLLFVGQHLRDFETFNACIPILVSKIKGLKVNVVIREDFTHFIKPHESISIQSNLSDLELRAMYQEASALFLPLTNVTACNSILEAMACGIPIITTDVGSNASYLSGTENILVPIKDTSFLIDATINLLKNEDKLTTIGKSSRTRVIDFEWLNIAKDVVNFYTLLASKSQTN